MNINELKSYLEKKEVSDEILSSLDVSNEKSKKQLKKQIIRVNPTDLHVQHDNDLELIETGFDFRSPPNNPSTFRWRIQTAIAQL